MFEFTHAPVMWSLDWGKATRVPNTSITINWHQFKHHVNLQSILLKRLGLHTNTDKLIDKNKHKHKQTARHVHINIETHTQQWFEIHPLQSTQWHLFKHFVKLHYSISLKRSWVRYRQTNKKTQNQPDMHIDTGT